MKPDEKGRAELLDGLKEWARKNFVLETPSLMTIEDQIEELLGTLVHQAVEGMTDRVAEEMAGIACGVEVELAPMPHGSAEDDLPLSLILGDGNFETLGRVSLAALLEFEINTLDETDADEEWGPRNGLSSAEHIRQTVAKRLRTLADRVEKMKGA